MDQSLADLIEQSIPRACDDRLRTDLRLELMAHIEGELRDLALRGCGADEALEYVISSFGEPTMIQEQFHTVHRSALWWKSIRKFLLFFAIVFGAQSLLSLLVIGWTGSFTTPIFTALLILPFMTIMMVFTPFFWIFPLLGAMLYGILSRWCLIYFPSDERRGRALMALAVAVVGVWLSLYISEKPFVAQAVDQQHIYALAGFPFQAFNYSYSVSATNDQWLWFALDWICWLVLGIGIGFVVPRRFLTSAVLPSIALIVMVLATCDGLTYLFLRFD